MRILSSNAVIGGLLIAAPGLKANQDAKHNESSFIAELSENTFESFVNSTARAFIKFYAPSCRYCKDMALDFQHAAERAATWTGALEVKFAQVDVTANPRLTQKLGIKGYPTLYLFRHGRRQRYQGPRTSPSFIHWLNRMLRPALVHVESLVEVRDLTGPDVATYLLEIDSVENPFFKIWEELASKNWPMGFFMVRVNPKNRTPSVSAIRIGEDAVITYELEEGALVQFLIAEAVPLFGELTHFNDQQFGMRTSKYFMFCGDIDDFEAVRNSITKVSKRYRSEFNFVWMNTTNPSIEARARRSFGFRRYPNSALVVNDDRYIFDGDYDERSLEQFLIRFKEGKLPKYLSSEPVPLNNDLPVKIVVGQTFEEMVFRQDNKDVLIVFYAPYCGPCQDMMPTWEKLATVLAPSTDIVVAKYDHSHNEIDVEGFQGSSLPSVFHIQGKTHEINRFHGELKSLESLLTFLYQMTNKDILLQRDEL
eukprot:Gregarina_sp_Poly_1__10420@NODE_750_length_6465_cov_191_781651_g557_i0_p3_GENE_NODE_750_length_6465_cov_191_781651_g557_i0NODE_750_length_6465_cov_191_781651_g557_i0_p3_ORF_typecomplete_len480_score64_60Thioredoxin/PF00085_20/4e23Thioredoxin/PF00085_20/1_1Thioredoxin/PF00085_20/6e16Thioredoxin_6/PF13848_6/0_89Thioredoxin_6/PF13848_6/0_0018Thioredoxin_6/PF13848_6/2_9e15Thioredoxin_6/PF13848_6/0_12Thioredoxin_2/PF13098_6/5_9e05Thioredoxin_2/PF13098_6/0_002Thioredoxin_7/PF13899_6/0_0035Thioredoxin_